LVVSVITSSTIELYPTNLRWGYFFEKIMLNFLILKIN
jgi:hypothetical protein